MKMSGWNSNGRSDGRRTRRVDEVDNFGSRQMLEKVDKADSFGSRQVVDKNQMRSGRDRL